MAKEIRIALLSKYFGWSGGIDFLRHIANGLLAKKDSHNVKIYLLLPVTNKLESPTDLLRVINRSIKATIKNKHLCIASPKPAFHDSMLDFFDHTQGGKVEIIYHDNSNAGLLKCLKKINADVALPVCGSLGIDFPIPWIGYIYDFQHKYLPDNFDPIECFNREIGFATTLRDSNALIVNSKAVKDDICRFYPWVDGNKVFNLPFAPHPLKEWFEPYQVNIKNQYNLPDKYFLISNQFWIHKDHLTAFRALKQIPETHNIGLVCTGEMSDHRHPDYVKELKHFIFENGLNEKLHLLGHIPKRAQIEIMKVSIAVIQPTLFEGGPGGGSVYDAVSLGVPVILSDIPVNKEVNAKNLHFFKSGDSDSLTEKMIEIINTRTNRPSQADLLHMGRNNLSNLGNTLLNAINHADL